MLEAEECLLNMRRESFRVLRSTLPVLCWRMMQNNEEKTPKVKLSLPRFAFMNEDMIFKILRFKCSVPDDFQK